MVHCPIDVSRSVAQNVETFTMFLNYDLLAKRWVRHVQVYPWRGLRGDFHAFRCTDMAFSTHCPDHWDDWGRRCSKPSTLRNAT